MADFRYMTHSHMKKAAAVSILLLMIFLTSLSSHASEGITDLSDLGNNKFSCRYNGQSRTFLEFPASCKTKGLIFLLHGAGESASAFRRQTSFDSAAAPHGYTVVFVDGLQSPNDKTASTGWNSLLTESNSVDDIGFLKSLAQFMQEKYGLTREETFAAGFSNGAFMMYRLALEGQDHFCAVASICGRMPEKLWPLRGEKASVGLLQISGTKDDVIPMHLNSTDKYTRSPAIEDVVAWFAESQGLSTEKETELAPGVVLFKYLEAGGTQKVWHVIVKDGHHGWFEKKYSGFDANDIILDFFDSYYA